MGTLHENERRLSCYNKKEVEFKTSHTTEMIFENVTSWVYNYLLSYHSNEHFKQYFEA